jgi:hypothetical protein
MAANPHHFFRKTNNGCLAYILGSHLHIEKRLLVNGPADVDPKGTCFYSCLTSSCNGLWEKQYECLAAKSLVRRRASALLWGELMNCEFDPTGSQSQSAASSAIASLGRPMQDFPDLRAQIMTKTINLRAKAILPPGQVLRDRTRHAWLSSSGGMSGTIPIRPEKRKERRKCHGSARAIESLRGLRKPFLPRPNFGRCLLPRL